MNIRPRMLGGLLAAALLTALTPAPAAATGTHADTDYVALGDSYSAGVGAPGQVGSCGRSPNGYPGRWAARHSPRTFTNLTCGGATTTDVRDRQVPSLTSGADLVSITIGGNDVGFGPTVLACLVGDDATCTAAVAAAEAVIRAALPAQLDATYAAIRAKAPTARIVVLDYPLLFDTTTESCDRLSLVKRRALNHGAQVLDRTIRDRVRAAGLTFADVRPAFASHGICSSTPYLHGPTLNPPSDSFHPNQDGYTYGYLPAFTRAAR